MRPGVVLVLGWNFSKEINPTSGRSSVDTSVNSAQELHTPYMVTGTETKGGSPAATTVCNK
jgi:hypothetical protein